eukprot:2971394-Rhodomonas_salina.3
MSGTEEERMLLPGYYYALCCPTKLYPPLVSGPQALANDLPAYAIPGTDLGRMGYQPPHVLRNVRY